MDQNRLTQVCVLCTCADNLALPAFVCHTPLLPQSISSARRAANLQRWVCCCGSMLGQTDRKTQYRFILDPAPHSVRTVATSEQFSPVGLSAGIFLK